MNAAPAPGVAGGPPPDRVPGGTNGADTTAPGPEATRPSTDLAVTGRAADHPARRQPRDQQTIVTSGRDRGADPEALRRAYNRCRRTAAAHGRTYYLATRLLAAEQRPAVHALYAFARMVDDIVDDPGPASAPAMMLDSVEFALRTSWLLPTTAAPPDPAPSGANPPLGFALSSAKPRRDSAPSGAESLLDSARPGTSPPHDSAPSDTKSRRDSALSGATRPLGSTRPGALPAGFDEIALALTDTVARFAIDPRHFWSFLDSMRMDAPGSPLFRNRYPTMAALEEYMHGSAAAIGLQLLPVLGTVGSSTAAEPAAAALGNAFQLTNFLRDIGEDLDRDRIYLPADELAAFGVDEALLRHCHQTRRTDRRVRRALAHLIAVNRDLYRRARPGIDLLAPRVRPGIRAAASVYAAILDRIEDSGYDVFAHRAVVPDHRRLRLAATAALPG